MSAAPKSQESNAQHTLVAEVSTAAANVGMALMSRRSQALADYWASVAHTREPGDLMAVQLNYWNHLVDDYAAAFTEVMAPITEAATPPKSNP